AAVYQRTLRGFSPDAMELLVQYPWPGNARELQNTVERAVLLCAGEVIGADHLPELEAAAASGAYGFAASMREEKRSRIQQALDEAGGNQAAAARRLGI